LLPTSAIFESAAAVKEIVGAAVDSSEVFITLNAEDPTVPRFSSGARTSYSPHSEGLVWGLTKELSLSACQLKHQAAL
jgi:hypothetical protein